MPIEIYLACGGVALAIPLLLYAVGAADKFADGSRGAPAGLSGGGLGSTNLRDVRRADLRAECERRGWPWREVWSRQSWSLLPI